MELLRTLTLGYAGVLVLALAVSLITIWIYLRKIAGALDAARAALVDAQRESRVLHEHLEPFGDLTDEAAREFEAAGVWLEEADGRLGALLERLGVRVPAR